MARGARARASASTSRHSCASRSRFTQRQLRQSVRDESGERWTVDEPEDLEVVQKVFEHFHPRRDFDWLEVLGAA